MQRRRDLLLLWLNNTGAPCRELIAQIKPLEVLINKFPKGFQLRWRKRVVLDMGKGNPSGMRVGVLRVRVRVQVFVPITIPLPISVIPIPTQQVYLFSFFIFIYLVTSYHCDIVTITALPNTTMTTATATTIIRHKYEPLGGRTRNMLTHYWWPIQCREHTQKQKQNPCMCLQPFTTESR